LSRPEAPLAGLARLAGAVGEPVDLDATDRRLLALLSADSRLSQRALARQLRMSPPAIGERIARLERLGVIRGYTVSIGWAALGYVTCYIAIVAVQGADQGLIMSALEQVPEIEDVSVITGSLDMIARMRVRDHAHLRNLLLNEIWQITGVQRTETFLSLAELATRHLGRLFEPTTPAESTGESG
jgi:Lrp/AsnC family transcriptional regulator, leucine-responsive regulatory protein